MKFRIIISFLLMSILLYRLSDTQSAGDAHGRDSTGIDLTSELSFKSRKNIAQQRAEVPFGVGEHFLFSIEYGPIKAGTATLAIEDIELVDGHPCYNIRSEARSGRTFSLFFKVRDDVESYLDIFHLFTRRFTKKLQEGKYHAHQEIDFDHNKLIATYHNGKQYEIPPNVQDVLSAFYYARTLDLKVGDEIAIDSHADKKNYPLLVKVHRKETVTVPAGEFDCLVIEPVLRSAGIFEQKGTLTVWVTDNAVKMPVLMKSKVFVGSIAAKLRTYQLGVGQ